MQFKLNSTYQPSGDQPEAIDQLCQALSQNVQNMTLLGVSAREAAAREDHAGRAEKLLGDER